MQEKKLPGWVVPVAAGGAIAAVVVGVGVYLSTRPQYISPEAEAAVAPGAGPGPIVPFTLAPVSTYTHEQIPVRAEICTQPPEGLTTQWYSDYNTVDAAWAGLNQQAKGKKFDSSAFWQIRNITEVHGGGDAEEVMYEGGFPLPTTMPGHKATYDAFMAKVKSDASAKAAADAAALLPSEDTQYEQGFKIDMITTNDPATGPVGTTTATITNPDGTADQTIQAASHNSALAQARAAVQLEMKGFATTTTYRGYKIVVTNFPKRDPRIGSKYEYYYIAPDGTQGPVMSAENGGTMAAQSQINQILPADITSVIYNKYTIVVQSSNNVPRTYYLQSITRPSGEVMPQFVLNKIGAKSTPDEVIVAAKAWVDGDISQAKANADAAAAMAKQNTITKTASDITSAWSAGKNAVYNNYTLAYDGKATINVYDSKGVQVIYPAGPGHIAQPYQQFITGNATPDIIARALMKAIDGGLQGTDHAGKTMGRFDGYQEGNRILFNNGAVVDWRRRPINPQGFDGKMSTREGYIW